MNIDPTPEIKQQAVAFNRAEYLKHLTNQELADFVAALALECLCRNIQVAGPLGLAAARIEAAPAVRRWWA